MGRSAKYATSHRQKLQKVPQMAGRSVLVVAACLVVLGLVPVTGAHADQYDEQIKKLQDSAAVDQQSVDKLQGKANDIGAQVSNLQQQIASTQSQIDYNQGQYDSLTTQIQQAEDQLKQERDTLGQNIRQMYLEGQTSTVEMLASSKNISSYLNKQEYRDSVKDKIVTTVKKISDLKVELSNKRNQISQLLDSQKQLRDNLAAQEAQADALLAQTNSDKSQFQASVASKTNQISSLRAQQAAANRSLGGRASYPPGNGGGGYPTVWANAPKDSMADTWNMLNRECVSYAAFRASQRGGDPSGWGNANQWPSAARAAGVPVDSSPRVGDVAISMIGAYGHAMYVEGVSGNTVYVSQYNYEMEGLYSTMTISTSGLSFIHF
jgi:peptidoglycan DL-endopeptidase CwlO